MLVILFSIVLIILNIHCFRKKEYLNLFVACMIFFPEFYAIDIGEKFPVISVVRIMFLVFLLYCIKNRKNEPLDFIFVLKKHRFLWLLAEYYLLRVISNVCYITVNNYSVKAIFELLMEQVLFIICLWMLAPTKDDIDGVIGILVNVSAIHFAIGVFESFTQIRPFDELYTVNRYMLNEHFYRMNVLRATTTFGLPGIYGNMCVLMIPLLIYQIRRTGKRIYIIHAFLCAMAILHSGSRADIFFSIFVVLLYSGYIILVDRKAFKELLIYCTLTAMIAACTIIAISSASDKFRYFYEGTFKSVLNEVGTEYDLDEGAPEGSGGYGENPNGTESRVEQLSGIIYVLENSPLIGFGAYAQGRGVIKYWRKDQWKASHTYDLGYVQAVMEEGIIGALGYAFLFLYMLLGAVYLMRRSRELSAFIIIYTLAYLICMLATANLKYLLLFGYGIEFAMLMSVECNGKEERNV